MAKGGRFVDIRKSPRTINNWRLVLEELEERGRSMHRIINYLVAQEAYESLMSSIPGGSEYKDLRKALQVSEVNVAGGGKNGAAYSVHTSSKARRVRKLDVPKTVIYIRAKKRLNKPDPAVQILEDRGPWTADTIPFWPSKRKATIVQRKVTKREADKVAKAQKSKLSKIKADLLEVGKRTKSRKPGDPGWVKRKGKAIPEVAMQALDMEFGTEGGPSKPVFRRTIGRIRKGIRRLPAKHKVIIEAMMDPNSKRYKSYPPRVNKIPQGEALKYVGFQKRLGY
jgi:hypothetical protein